MLPFLNRASSFPKVAQRTCSAILLAGGLFLAACSKDHESGAPALTPDAVMFTQTGLYPEGVQYDAANSRFLVSSLTTGAIGQVRDDGTYTAFADGSALVSTVGLNLDEPRNRLLAAVSDPGYNSRRTNLSTKGKLAQLAIFNRNSPQLAPIVLDLGGLRPNAPGHFANDIAVDTRGNIYVTDSFAPVIYKIDPTQVVTVFAENPQFAAPAGSFGLNGIVFHPDGYLLVAKSDEGILFKIPLNNPSGFTRVATGQNLQGADGMRLQENNILQVVTNAQAKVYRLSTTDSWATASVTGTFTTPPQYPTTLARRDGSDGYVLYSNLNALQASRLPPVSQFTITKVKF